MPKLLSEKEIKNGVVFYEKAGMINMYTCNTCSKSVIYVYIDDGVTPNTIKCDCCNGIATSQLPTMQQPSRFWYRPHNIQELKLLAEAAWNINEEQYKEQGLVKRDMIKQILSDYVNHYNKGGLFARSIK